MPSVPATLLTSAVLCSSLVLVFGASVSLEKMFPVEHEKGRIFWDQIGDFFDDYFPITINIPNVISGIGNFIGGAFSYFFGGGSSTSA